MVPKMLSVDIYHQVLYNQYTKIRQSVDFIDVSGIKQDTFMKLGKRAAAAEIF